MEASIRGGSVQKATKKPAATRISKALQDTRQKQIRYLTVVAMMFGALFLGYSFLKKDEHEEEE